ncbi:nuclear transport factor 2 family protein [Saccharopolyspora montiporae]|uniref:nuclear transport factor 2 family protein n=1 Tax=Saccharopolyspora montiporae TaxID=2781240 RepID=UPI001D15B7A3|nr:nuclear transport factor 2 family protein [Saccharopolyspora sp. HNM0983]
MQRDVQALNAGDYHPLLANYADDAVLHFPDGEHRFAGDHRGKQSIERFLQEFVAAGLQGEVHDLVVSGPPWRMTMIVRFDDHALGPQGEQLYANRAVLLIRAQWGRVVEHTDFFENTERITHLERRLRERDADPGS